MKSQNFIRWQEVLCSAWTRDLHVENAVVLGRKYEKIILPNASVDGAQYEIFALRSGDSVTLRDFGLTLMNLEANNVNIESETMKRKIIRASELYAKDSSYETREFIRITSTQEIEEAFLDFVNLLTVVGSFALDADFKAQFTFEDEVDMILRSTYGHESVIRDWSDSAKDPESAYKTDYLINRDDKKPAAAFAISRTNSAKVAKAALAFTHYKDDFLKVLLCKDFSRLSAPDRVRARDHADVIIETISGSEVATDRLEILSKVPR